MTTTIIIVVLMVKTMIMMKIVDDGNDIAVLMAKTILPTVPKILSPYNWTTWKVLSYLTCRPDTTTGLSGRFSLT